MRREEIIMRRLLTFILIVVAVQAGLVTVHFH